MADNSLPYFPSSIRSPDMNGGVVVSTYKPVLRTETEGNLVAVRPRAALSRKRITLKWTAMPASDKRVLEGFFVANQGRVFLFTNPADNAVYRVTFSDDQLQFSSLKYDGSIGEMRYGCTVNLEECGESIINSNSEPYLIVMEVTIPAADTTVVFGYTGKGLVDYGDGDTENVEADEYEENEHTYEEEGVYQFVVYADNFSHFQFNSINFTAIKRFNVPEIFTDASEMFAGCGITEIPDFFMHPETITNAFSEFSECTRLARIGNSFRNVDATTDARSQFYGCEALASIGNFTNGANTIRCDGQFFGCTSLVSTGSLANSPKAIGLEAQFESCENLEFVDFSALFPYFKQNLSVRRMFDNCPNLSGTVPPSRTFNSTGGLFTDTTQCFNGCISLENYYLIPNAWGGPATGTVSITFKYGGTNTAVTSGTATLTLGGWSETANINSSGVASFTNAPLGNPRYGISAEIEGYSLIQFYAYASDILYVWPAVESNTVRFKVQIPSSKVYNIAIKANGSSDKATVEWGDGNSSQISFMNLNAAQHTYSAAGNYTVTVTNAKHIKLDGQTANGSSTTTYGAMVTEIISADLECLTNCAGMFENCLNLTSIPPTLFLPRNVSDMSYMFWHTPLLEIPATLWPDGYRPTSISLAHAFEQSSVRTDMTGTIPADRLWNDTSVTWNAIDCFKNCDSLDNYDEIPSVWGGGN